jgi:hypothetical protein
MTLALMSVIGILATGTVHAAAPTPSCAEVVLNDWYDGALDGIYDPECYQEALRRLPEDVRVYTTAVDDLTRAMRKQLAVEGETTSGRSARSLSGVRKSQSREKADTRVAVGQATEARRPPLPLLLLATVVVLLAAGTVGTFVAHRVRRRSSA